MSRHASPESRFDALFPPPTVTARSAPSAARLAANRANAQRSTGPRTRAGKARSRANAVSHGLFCRRLLVASASLHEHQDEFDALHQQWRSELKPQTRRESDLVELICVGLLRRQRYQEIEGMLLQKLDRDPEEDGLERFMRGAASRQSALASIGREIRAWTRELEQAQTRRLGGMTPDWVDHDREDAEAHYALAPPAGFVEAPAPAAPTSAARRNETDEEYCARLTRDEPLPPGYIWTIRNGTLSIVDQNVRPYTRGGRDVSHELRVPGRVSTGNPSAGSGGAERDRPQDRSTVPPRVVEDTQPVQAPIEPPVEARAEPAPAAEDSCVLVTQGTPPAPEPW